MSILDRIILTNAPTPARTPAPDPHSAALQEVRDRQKEARDAAARDAAIEAAHAAKDKATAAEKRAEFVRDHPKANTLEIAIFDAHTAVWLAQRVCDRNPDKKTRRTFDGSRESHPYVHALRFAQSRLTKAIEARQRMLDIIGGNISTAKTGDANIALEYFRIGKRPE